ncbi:MAG: hypothetical protein GFH27_549291n348 [Chloroflexi bacterium AL-W]|nr:hypothetical protein [Chloroflexi bacterium AL-N1]NOK67184.1 hypothetical protein [Chloroflexi bacterium AL-N10]NOK75322.1 hypothetical protein [Chloroflexi bacterium AL-N5]NOK82110.1 hypothetical protein [Chloroflexi bacterium AL-W]NOK89955.1 hypothetical protein [Chloroflexi bacterium AL-N15]
MATLIKVENEVFDLEGVSIQFDSESVRAPNAIVFCGERKIIIRGAAAEALRWWIEGNSMDIMTAYRYDETPWTDTQQSPYC